MAHSWYFMTNNLPTWRRLSATLGDYALTQDRFGCEQVAQPMYPFIVQK